MISGVTPRLGELSGEIAPVCNRKANCPHALSRMIAQSACFDVLVELGGLSSTTPDEKIEAACKAVRAGVE